MISNRSLSECWMIFKRVYVGHISWGLILKLYYRCSIFLYISILALHLLCEIWLFIYGRPWRLSSTRSAQCDARWQYPLLAWCRWFLRYWAIYRFSVRWPSTQHFPHPKAALLRVGFLKFSLEISEMSYWSRKTIGILNGCCLVVLGAGLVSC